jgi:hypothetical protein
MKGTHDRHPLSVNKANVTVASRLEAFQAILKSFHLGENLTWKVISELLEKLLLASEILMPS